MKKYAQGEGKQPFHKPFGPRFIKEVCIGGHERSTWQGKCSNVHSVHGQQEAQGSIYLTGPWKCLRCKPF